MNDHTPHQSLVAVQTDGPHRIIVETGEQPRDDGRWFRVLNWLVDAGIMAQLTDPQVRVLFVLLRHREYAGGRAIVQTVQIAAQAGLGVRATQLALRQLSEHPAALLASHGAGIWEPLPDRSWAGRAPPCAEAHSHAPERTAVRPALPPLRARAKTSQPEEEKDRSGFETTAREASGRLTAASLERFARARAQGMAGWKGFPLWWSLEGVECPRLAMGMLEVREPIRGAVLAIGEQTRPITVPEIAGHAEAIVNDPTAQKPAVLLCWRLCKARGHDLPVSGATAKRRDARAAGLEELRERRVQEAVRAAGGGR